MELKDLEKMTVGELRELAKKYEDLTGVSGMKKDALVGVLCDKMGIERKVHLPKGIGRHATKVKIKAIRKRRDEALKAGDRAALKRSRTLLRRAKHRIRDIVEHALKHQPKPKGETASS